MKSLQYICLAIATSALTLSAHPSAAKSPPATGDSLNRKGKLTANKVDIDQAYAHLRLGDKLSAVHDWRGAITSYSRSIAHNAMCGQTYLMRAAARQAIRDYSGAISDYTRCRRLEQTNSAALWGRGYCLSKINDETGAIAEYSKVVEMYPYGALSYLRRGDALAGFGRNKEAIHDFNRAIELNSKNAAVYSSRALARHATGDTTGGMSDFDEAIRLEPKNCSYYCQRGYFRSKHGNIRGALADYNHSILLNRHYGDAYAGRGLIKSDIENSHSNALAEFDRGIAEAPQSAICYDYRAYEHLMLKNYPAAVHDFNMAEKLHRDVSALYVGRGICQYNLGNYKASLADLDKSIAMGLECGTGHYYRAKCRLHFGDHLGAASDYSLACKLYPAYVKQPILGLNTYTGVACVDKTIDVLGQALRQLQYCLMKAFGR